MSDYLRSLWRRSVGPAPGGVRPRPRALFEPDDPGRPGPAADPGIHGPTVGRDPPIPTGDPPTAEAPPSGKGATGPPSPAIGRRGEPRSAAARERPGTGDGAARREGALDPSEPTPSPSRRTRPVGPPVGSGERGRGGPEGSSPEPTVAFRPGTADRTDVRSGGGHTRLGVTGVGPAGPRPDEPAKRRSRAGRPEAVGRGGGRPGAGREVNDVVGAVGSGGGVPSAESPADVEGVWARSPEGSRIRVWSPVHPGGREAAGLHRDASGAGAAAEARASASGVAPVVRPRAPAERETEGSSGGDAAGGGGPVVRVTIGRVEVKAAAPARRSPPSGAARRREPPLSLEDYLKRRGEEGA